MTIARTDLTELEGAVLSEIHDRGCKTAFQVRRAFQTSASLEWSGSAGAVYPAIRRLQARGLIEAKPMLGGRHAMALQLSPAGITALHGWACDPGRAASVGIDPFRLRSGIWRTLDAAPRRAALEGTAEAIRSNLTVIEGDLAKLDAVEQARVALAMEVQRLRLKWIAIELGEVQKPDEW
jgi:DNA-binding PadR family transcriptional regulator